MCWNFGAGWLKNFGAGFVLGLTGLLVGGAWYFCVDFLCGWCVLVREVACFDLPVLLCTMFYSIRRDYFHCVLYTL